MGEIPNKKNYDLEERTAKFSEDLINFLKSVSKDTITKPLINQATRSGTSIGANYMEANAASSRKDFRNKIFICKKEAKETGYWLRMISKAVPEAAPSARILWKEVHELTLIFGKITSSLKD